MSLFDVIKYPISDIPKQAELEALPDKLFHKWMCESTEWRTHSNVEIDKRKARIGAYYELNILDQFDRRDIELLRKIIKEYDESI